MPIDPMSQLFGQAGDLMGGIKVDVTTALLAMMVIGFILIGLDYLRDVIDEGVSNARDRRERKAAAAEKIKHKGYGEEGSEFFANNGGLGGRQSVRSPIARRAAPSSTVKDYGEEGSDFKMGE